MKTSLTYDIIVDSSQQSFYSALIKMLMGLCCMLLY